MYIYFTSKVESILLTFSMKKEETKTKMVIMSPFDEREPKKDHAPENHEGPETAGNRQRTSETPPGRSSSDKTSPPRATPATGHRSTRGDDRDSTVCLRGAAGPEGRAPDSTKFAFHFLHVLPSRF